MLKLSVLFGVCMLIAVELLSIDQIKSCCTACRLQCSIAAQVRFWLVCTIQKHAYADRLMLKQCRSQSRAKSEQKGECSYQILGAPKDITLYAPNSRSST